jgi:hypothetical protein
VFPDIGYTRYRVYADIGCTRYRVSLKSAPISESISEYTDIGTHTPISAFGKNPDGGSSPARSRRPFHRGSLRVGVRVGLLVPKATERLFKLEAGFAPTARSAGGGDGVVGPPCVRVNQRPVPVQPKVPKPRLCASTPLRLIDTITGELPEGNPTIIDIINYISNLLGGIITITYDKIKNRIIFTTLSSNTNHNKIYL